MNEQLPNAHNYVEPQYLGYVMLHCVELSDTGTPVTDAPQSTVFEAISEEVIDILPRAATTTMRIKGVTTNKDGSWEWDEMELSKEDD
jgi:hypothetical protein